MVKEYKVGDVVMVPATVVGVHPQGFPSGLDKFGRPMDPTESETPHTIVARVNEPVLVDGAGHVHFSAAAEI